MTAEDFPVRSTTVGPLGVCHLKRLWSRVLQLRSGRSPAPGGMEEWNLDRMVLDGLGLALEETMEYLGQQGPSYEDFERWVLAKNGGNLEPRSVRRINAIVRGLPYDEDLQQWLRGVEQSEPVLTAADLAFWEEHGYVILHDAISPEECRAAERTVWEHLGLDPQDPETWYRKRRSHGIMVQFFHDPALAANRRSPRIHKAFAQVWGTADLWVTTDRVSFNPPERPGWHFPGPRLHWDAVFEVPFPFGVQGLLYLTDTPAEQGAFTCVPGFHRRIEDWLRALPAGADPQQQDLESLGPMPIAGKAGDLVIWHKALPHGSRPNRGSRPRLVHYVKMYPVTRNGREAGTRS
jgi:hypothetical protein